MAGSSNVSGDESILFADNMSFDGTQRGGAMTTNGELWIGSTVAPHVRKGTLVAGPGVDITPSSGSITIGLSGGGVGIDTVIPNTGINVVPDGTGSISILTSNTTLKTNGTANTLTTDFGILNLLMGSPGTTITSGNLNVGLGPSSLASLTQGNNNTAIGQSALTLLTTGSSNTAVGAGSISSNVSSGSNAAVGINSLVGLLSGTGQNVAIGTQALGTITTGATNIGVGYQAGNSYTTSDSSNIAIGNLGTAGESGIIRIGTSGTHTQTHIAGVLNTSSGRVVKTTVPGAYPYTTLITDYIVLVDTSAARTINLVATPVTGTTYRIKDNVGTAAAFNITITPAAGLIDGLASQVISSNWGSMDLVYNSTGWRVL